MSSPASRVSAALLASFVVFLWATSWVLVKLGLEAIPPLTFAGLRYGLASLVLLPAIWLSGGISSLRSLDRHDLGRLVLLGILLYGVTQGAVFLALDLLPAVTVNLLWSFSSVVVAGMAALWLNEAPTRLQWIGVVASTTGALVYFLPARLGQDMRLGLLVAALGVAANAAAVTLGRGINRSGRWPPVVVTGVSMVTGAVLLLGVGWTVESAPRLNLNAWAIVVWLALVNTALAFTLWNRTQRVLTAVESSVINSTMLIWVPLLAVTFLGESLSPKELAGLVLVGLGTLLVQLRRLPARQTGDSALNRGST
jgi:drug/metabolite transporter (DMT)-like permease